MRARTTTPSPPGVRIGLGAGLATAGAVGLLHLARGGPSFDAGVDAPPRRSGRGRGLGRPAAHRLLGTVGAAIVLVLAVLGGVLLATRTSLSTVARATAAAAVPTARALRRALASLFQVGEKEPTIDLTDDGPSVSVGGEPAGAASDGPAISGSASTTRTPTEPRSRSARKTRRQPSRHPRTRTARRPSSSRSRSGPPASGRPGSCPRPSCSRAPARKRSTPPSVQETGRNLEHALGHPRRRDPARRHDRRPDRHPLRARARPRA